MYMKTDVRSSLVSLIMETACVLCQVLAEAEETVDDLSTYSPALWAPILLSREKQTAANVWRRFNRGNNWKFYRPASIF